MPSGDSGCRSPLAAFTGAPRRLQQRPMPPARFTVRHSRRSLPTFATLLSASPFLAIAQTWNNPGTGDWFTGSNWSSGLVPDGNGTATIDEGTAVISGQNASASSIIFGQAVSGSGASLTVNDGGVLTSSSAQLGYTAGTQATATITGTGSQWNASGSVYIGRQGTGRLDISQGATVSFTDSTSAAWETGGTGIITVSDAGTTWNTQGLSLGYRGTATLSVTDNATLANTSGAQLGVVAGSSGTVDLNRGARWTNTGELTLGLFGNGVIHLDGGSELTAAASTLGADTVATGSVTLEGGSSWTNSAELILGMSGTGHLNIYEGSTVTNTDAVIGYYASSHGVVEIGGENSQWINTDSLYVGVAGYALLKIYDLGRVTVGGDSIIRLGQSGEIQIGGGGTAGALDAATVTATAGGKITFKHTETAYAFSPNIKGTVSIAQIGSGRTILSGANTFSGSTTISGGTLAAGAVNVLSANSAIFINKGTLDLAGYNQTVGDLDSYNFGTGENDSGTVLLGGATLTNLNRVTNNWAGALTGNGTLVKKGSATMNWYGANTFTGFLQIDAGTLSARTENTLSANAVVHVASSATLALESSQTIAGLSGSGGVSIGSSKLTIAQATDTTFSGTITGRGEMVKTGNGTLTFSGSKTGNGATSVNSGKLFVNGSLGNTAVTVKLAATLGGSGSIGGLTTVQSGGHLAAGASLGTLTFTGGLTLNTGAFLDFELGTSSDKIRVSGGTLTGPGSGTLTVNLFDSGGFTAGTYTLIDATGATLTSIGATNFELGTVIAGYNFSFSQSGKLLQLTATAIPEPAAFAALAGAFTLGLGLIRHHRRRRAVHA